MRPNASVLQGMNSPQYPQVRPQTLPGRDCQPAGRQELVRLGLPRLHELVPEDGRGRPHRGAVQVVPARARVDAHLV